VKRASKRKRHSKTIPALGAAGLSLTLASEASLAATVPALDTMAREAGVSHEIILREEEIFDVTLASFYVFDKERAAGAQARSEKAIKPCHVRARARRRERPVSEMYGSQVLQWLVDATSVSGLVICGAGMVLVMGILAWASHLDHRRKVRRQH
jgi:hypothetical protein